LGSRRRIRWQTQRGGILFAEAVPFGPSTILFVGIGSALLSPDARVGGSSVGWALTPDRAELASLPPPCAANGSNWEGEMAWLFADDDFALQIRLLRYSPPQDDKDVPWLDYEFNFLYKGQPLFDPSLLQQSSVWGERLPAGIHVSDYAEDEYIGAVLEDALNAGQESFWQTEILDACIEIRPNPERLYATDPAQEHSRWLVTVRAQAREMGCGSNSGMPVIMLNVSRAQLQQFRNALAAEWLALEPTTDHEED
jgi:hypothetical protein